MIRHPFSNANRPDLTRLREILSERIGHRVELLTSADELIVESSDGERLDVDANLVASALTEVERGPFKTLEAQTVERIDNATTPAAKLNAIRDYLVAQEQQRVDAIERSKKARAAFKARLLAETAEHGGVGA